MTKIIQAVEPLCLAYPAEITLSNKDEASSIRDKIKSVLAETEAILDKYEIDLRDELTQKIGADYIGAFSEGRAFAVWHMERGKEVNIIDRTGKKIRHPHYGNFVNVEFVNFRQGVGWIYIKGNGGAGSNSLLVQAIDLEGNQIFEDHIEEIDFSDLENGGTVLCRKSSSMGKANLCFYLKVESGQVEKLFHNNGKLGNFTEASPFSEGIAWVRDAGKYVFINQEGENLSSDLTLALFADKLQDFSEDVVWVKDITGQWPAKLLDSHGKQLFELATAEFKPSPYHDGRSRITVGDEPTVKYIFIDKKNTQIGGEYRMANDFSEGLAAVSRNGVFFEYIDVNGKEIIKGMTIEDAGGFHDGIALVYFNSVGYQFIDKTGKIIIDKVFNKAEEFHDGVAKVEDKTGSYYIDKKGRRVFG